MLPHAPLLRIGTQRAQEIRQIARSAHLASIVASPQVTRQTALSDLTVLQAPVHRRLVRSVHLATSPMFAVLLTAHPAYPGTTAIHLDSLALPVNAIQDTIVWQVQILLRRRHQVIRFLRKHWQLADGAQLADTVRKGLPIRYLAILEPLETRLVRKTRAPALAACQVTIVLVLRLRPPLECARLDITALVALKLELRLLPRLALSLL
jgi:hypothetical protein